MKSKLGAILAVLAILSMAILAGLPLVSAAVAFDNAASAYDQTGASSVTITTSVVSGRTHVIYMAVCRASGSNSIGSVAASGNTVVWEGSVEYNAGTFYCFANGANSSSVWVGAFAIISATANPSIVCTASASVVAIGCITQYYTGATSVSGFTSKVDTTGTSPETMTVSGVPAGGLASAAYCWIDENPGWTVTSGTQGGSGSCVEGANSGSVWIPMYGSGTFTVNSNGNYFRGMLGAGVVLSSMGPPSVQTNAATAIGLSGGTLNGQVTNLNGQGSVDCGFRWDTVSPPVALNTTVLATYSGSVPHSFSHAVSGFGEGVVVYFRAWCLGNSDSSFVLGSILSFTTDSRPHAEPSVADSIMTQRANINANLTTLGDLGDSSASVGFWWGTDATPTGAQHNDTALTGIVHLPTMVTDSLWAFPGTFDFGFLQPNTTYYYKAWALGNLGNFEASSTIINFTTLKNLVIVTEPADSITATSARMNANVTDLGDIGRLVPWGFLWGTSPTLVGATNDTGGAFIPITLLTADSVSGLTPATTYYFRAWAGDPLTAPFSYAQGGIASFTTPAVHPSIATLPATFVTSEGATLNANLSVAGTFPASVAFYVSTNASMTNATFYFIGNFSSPTLIGLTLHNLANNTTYYFFVSAYVALDSNYTANGSVLNFTTLQTGTNPGMDFFSSGFVALVIGLMTVLVWGAVKVRQWRERRGME